MARIMEPSQQQMDEWREWVASRPTEIRQMIERHQLDPWSLYRLKTTGHRVTLLALSEDGTVRVAVTGEFNCLAFERQVFGINPADLEPCDLPLPDEILGSANMSIADIRKARNDQ